MFILSTGFIVLWDSSKIYKRYLQMIGRASLHSNHHRLISKGEIPFALRLFLDKVGRPNQYHMIILLKNNSRTNGQG